MTPFGTVLSNKTKNLQRKIIMPDNELTDFDKFLLNEAENHEKKKCSKNQKQSMPSTSKSHHVDLKSELVNPSKSENLSDFQTFTDMKAVPRKKHKTKIKLGSKYAKGFSKKKKMNMGLVKNYKSDSEVSDFNLTDDDCELSDGDKEYIPDEEILEDSGDFYPKSKTIAKKRKPVAKLKKTTHAFSASSDSDTDKKCEIKKMKKIKDDGDQKSYINRIRVYEKAELLKKHKKILEAEDGVIESDDNDFTEFEGDYKVPNSVWNRLYKYQQTAVRWLWELHQQNCGGIIGDEMGLGKTIQIIAFLVGLKESCLKTDGDVFTGLGPVILVCPATVMHQWVKEFHTWWPMFRVAILHESGSFTGKKECLVRLISKSKGILITSYAGVVQHQNILLEHEWHYVILDEGHKIRNPASQATLVVKQFRTPHRLILSGSPIQNNLKELWSLFDFIFPGKLGTLPVFMQQFSVPIVQGGYANASQIQVQTAYKCATILRDTIKPYLLRRMKTDVKMSINLPNKSEQVLFCQLADEQAALYKGYINSKEVDSILNARLQVFVGLINLRKICNHPDIFDGGPKIFKDTDISILSEEEQYGYYKRSGKMIVIEALLRLWHKQGHRVLLFTQSRQMMDIFEIFVKSRNYTYMKMDGSTSISSRQPAIAKFNADKSIFVFLLTTRVGGLGVNLTGADRVVIYDPDWNPSTDAQARERAWRIGQDKQVTIYRLLTAGTIEEKIYHRQIFKQFVTNRVLKDPRQRRFFKSNDLYELFTFNEVGPQGTETSAIFAGTGSEVKPKKHSQKRPTESERDSAIHPQTKDTSVSFSSKKLEQMKQLAKKLSFELSKKRECKEDTTFEIKSKPITNDNSQSNNVSAHERHGENALFKDCKKETISEAKCESKARENLQGDHISVEKKQSKETLDKGQLEVNIKKEKKTPSKNRPVFNMERGKKSRKKKSHKIDGEKIDFLVKKDVYKPPQDESDKNMKQDDYVLSKLFKKSGVHTALKHDAIVEASNPDYMIVEGEANKVAKDAIKALKESRRMCARAVEGIPTWTGHNGGAKPRFGEKKRVAPCSPFSDNDNTQSKSPLKFAKKLSFDGQGESSTSVVSSSDLLSAINKRKNVFGTDHASDSSENEHTPSFQKELPSATEHDELLVEIRNFIAFRAGVDGQATTKELLDAFQDKLPVHQTVVFKAMLNKICDFTRTSNGEGIWYLKGEFR